MLCRLFMSRMLMLVLLLIKEEDIRVKARLPEENMKTELLTKKFSKVCCITR